MSTLLDSCIDQHGEIARTYIDIALRLGGMCLLPDVGFDSSLQGIIDDLLQSQDPERSGVRDVKVFAKSSSYAEFSRDTIELHNVIELSNVGKQLYPQEMAMMEVYDRLDEYWNESDIYRRARDIDPQAFSLWMNAIFAESPEAEEPEDFDRKAKVVKLVEILNSKLFSSSKRNISMYCTTEDNNENTSFAPYFFVGNSCVAIIAKRWIL